MMVFDYIKAASEVFGGTRYHATMKEIEVLAASMQNLDEREMKKLTVRLLNGGRNIWDTFSEHNFAHKLISLHPHTIHISYEPDEGLRRPIDFKVVIGEITYWFQMKRLSTLERENRQSKIVDTIKREAKDIKVGMFFGCDLSDDFCESDIPGLIKFLKTKALTSKENEKHEFPGNGKTKAIVDFWHPGSSKLSSLTLGMSGDMDVIEETGRPTKQIRQSIFKAAGAFEWKIGPRMINLVAIDSTKYEDIDLCDAVFGTEHEIFRAGSHTWGRSNDGIFCLPEMAKKVAGVIALKSIGRSPVSELSAALYLNESCKDRIDDMKKVLPFDNIIHFNMRPPMGQGNF